MAKELFFDGNCPFCSKTVMKLARLDSNNLFTFISNCSERGKNVLKEYGMLETSKSTIILKIDGKFYLRSVALEKFLSIISKYSILVLCMKLLPRILLDKCYDFIAENRLSIVKNHCEIPTKQMSKKFILN